MEQALVVPGRLSWVPSHYTVGGILVLTRLGRALGRNRHPCRERNRAILLPTIKFLVVNAWILVTLPLKLGPYSDHEIVLRSLIWGLGSAKIPHSWLRGDEPQAKFSGT